MQTIEGKAASRGEATGTARVLAGPGDGDKIRRGDVLITRMTEPAMTPAMARAAAIATAIGGVTCHAAIVAREYGKPCVVACGDALLEIADGTRVTVSANGRGEVRIGA